MTSYLFVILGAVLVNNVVLVRILGLCPFMGVSKKLDTAVGMGAATTFVLTLGCGTSYLVDHYVLIPAGVDYLRTLAFIVIIAAIVQVTELVIQKTSPVLHQVLGIYLPLITTNCAVLGVPLLNVALHHDLLESLLFGFGSSVGFSLVLVLFAGIRERLDGADVPAPFKGTAIAMVTAGLMSLAFMGFAGLDKYPLSFRTDHDHRTSRHDRHRPRPRSGAGFRLDQVQGRRRPAGRQDRRHPAADPVRPVRLPGLPPLRQCDRRRRGRDQPVPARRRGRHPQAGRPARA
jgi:electron transport complex protein RnfA